MYAGNQSDHHLSEKNSADAFFNRSKAIKFKAIVIASPSNPIPSNPIVLNGFRVLRVCDDAYRERSATAAI